MRDFVRHFSCPSPLHFRTRISRDHINFRQLQSAFSRWKATTSARLGGVSSDRALMGKKSSSLWHAPSPATGGGRRSGITQWLLTHYSRCFDPSLVSGFWWRYNGYSFFFGGLRIQLLGRTPEWSGWQPKSSWRQAVVMGLSLIISHTKTKLTCVVGLANRLRSVDQIDEEVSRGVDITSGGCWRWLGFPWRELCVGQRDAP